MLLALIVLKYPRNARGYLWTPTIGQVLQLKREPDNCIDKYAIAIVLGRVVGHVPYNLAKCVSQLLSRDAKKGLRRLQATELIVELDTERKYLLYTACMDPVHT